MLSSKSLFLRVCACASAAALLALTGCGQFFPPLGSGGGGGGGSASGDYIYVGNIATNPLTIAGFSIASSTLGTLSGSPFSVSVEPNALAITPDNSLLYLGSAAGDIYVYTIGSNGALTLGNNGSPVASGITPSVLRVDPTGNYLIGGSSFSGQAFVYQIVSGGGLNSISSSLVTLSSTAPVTDLQISPNGNYVFASLGTAGIYEMSFSTSTGAMAQINGVLNPKVNNAADQGLAVSPSGSYLFAAETVTGGVRVFTIGTNGVLTEASGSPYTTNTGAWSVLVDSTGSYVYVANRTSGTISAFLLSNTGALTAVSGSPFTTGTLPVAMVEDQSKAYIAVICTGGSPDLQVFSISSTTPGALTSLATARTGTDPTQASSLAATH